MNTDRQTRRRASRTGVWIAIVTLFLIAALAAYGIVRLMQSGLRTLDALGNAGISDGTYALDPVERPTRPPEADITPAPVDTEDGAEWQDVPVVSTPEQLAQTADDTTPPPDAPIG